MKNTLNFVAVFTLATSAMAGGDDRDLGPIEAFDDIDPIVQQVIVDDKDPQEMLLTSDKPKTDKAVSKEEVKVDEMANKEKSKENEVMSKKVPEVKKAISKKKIRPKNTAKKAAKKAAKVVKKATKKVTKVVKKMPAKAPVKKIAKVSCQKKFGLGDDNVNRFKGALSDHAVYNTGPVDSLGTLFSPNRWANYYTCAKD